MNLINKLQIPDMHNISAFYKAECLGNRNSSGVHWEYSFIDSVK